MTDTARIDQALDELRVALHEALERPLVEPALMSIDEAAERLSISRRTLMARIADGSIRSVKVGRRRLVPLSVLEDIATGRTP
jgi:excisionase family DNA binding protein